MPGIDKLPIEETLEDSPQVKDPSLSSRLVKINPYHINDVKHQLLLSFLSIKQITILSHDHFDESPKLLRLYGLGFELLSFALMGATTSSYYKTHTYKS